MAQSPQITDDTPTLLAAGIVAYVAETLAHEALGHGGVCLASGGSLLVLAPLWMRCSVTTLLLVAAGPAVNVLAALACFAALRMAKPRHALTGLLLWLGFIFNALVACGYLAVGAASGFGDWPYLFAAVRPQLAWRAPGLFLAACGYYGCLRAAAALFRDLAGSGPPAQACLRRRALVPAYGAAFVACAAECTGARAQPMPLLLALACTLAVGFSVTSMDETLAAARPGDRDLGYIHRAPWLIAAALAIGGGFIMVIGPGLDLSSIG